MPDEPTPTPAPDEPPERGGEGGQGDDDFLESLVNDPVPPVDEAGEQGDEGEPPDGEFLESLVDEPDPRPH